MAPRSDIFDLNSFHHIFNRGAGKQAIFFQDWDYIRFVDLLTWCQRYDYPYSRYLSRVKQAKLKGTDPSEVLNSIREIYSYDTQPVDLIAWVLMPNHYHLILKQNVEDGISSFMHKVGTAYSMYVNIKHDRSGTLFQGAFKGVWVETEEQFKHVVRYVHLNPFAARLVKDFDGLVKFPWSSLTTYLDREKGNDSIIVREHLDYFFPTPESLRSFTEDALLDSPRVLEGVTLDDDFNWY